MKADLSDQRLIVSGNLCTGRYRCAMMALFAKPPLLGGREATGERD